MPPPFYCEVIGQNIGVAGPSDFNRLMHIFFAPYAVGSGGSGRRQRAKLLKVLFPEKHGYV